MEDGSLKAIGKDAEKAAKGTDKATRSADKYSKKNKGVANATSNSTKAFSKMTTGISAGLVPAYATLAANVFALTAAFGLLARNDAISKLNEGLEYTGSLAGRNLTMVADKLKEITDNAISAEQAMRAVAVGTSAGFSESQLTNLTKVAKGAALALGRDMGDAMDRLIRGAAKLEPEILDELGIMVRLDDAVKKYADSMNRSTDSLTQFERRMAFTNAIIEDGQKKFSAIQEAINPSAYGQLSATFSDLTKSIIEVVNFGLTPMFKFLAANQLALGAVMAAFGASISKDLVGSIQEHTEASAKNAKISANQAKAQLKNIKVTGSMTKHMKSLVRAEGMQEAQLKRLQRLSHAQVNLMNKSNPNYAKAVKTRRALTTATFKFTIAESKANASTALSMLTTHGFTLARAEHIAVMRAQDAATAKAIVGQDALTAAKLRTSAALFKLGANTKFYGTALLQVFPLLMAVFTAVSILGPMLVGLFKEPEDGLSKILKKTQERIDKFADVVARYAEQIEKAESATEAWHSTIKPVSGLLSQVAGALDEANLAAQTDLILEQAKGKKELAAAEELANRALLRGGSILMSLDVAKKRKEIKLGPNISEEDLDAVYKNQEQLLAGLLGSLEAMSDKLREAGDEGILAAESLELLESVTDKVRLQFDVVTNPFGKTLEGAIETSDVIKQLSDEMRAALAAYEDFENIKAEAGKLNAVSPQGMFGKELENLQKAGNSLSLIQEQFGDTAANEEAFQMLKKYGQDTSSSLMAMIGHTENGMVALDKFGNVVKSDVELLKDFTHKIKTLNMNMEEAKSLQAILGDESKLVYDYIKRNTEERLEIEMKKLRNTEKGSKDEYNQKIKTLGVERELLALVKERYAVISGDAEDSGMGAAASAAISGQGAISAAKNATYEDSVDKDGNITESAEDKKSQALDAAVLAQQKDILSGVAKDLAKIGPEGELMSSVISGFNNMHTAFSAAAEIMEDKSASMSTKIQAGLGAITATISAIGGAQKAASEQRIRALDNEIQAEKNRDGKSEASLAKISGLEKKREAEKRKAFEQEKKMKIAQTVISTMQGAIAAYSSLAVIPVVGPALGAAAAAMVLKMGADQVAAIRATSFNGGSVNGGKPEKISAGSRSNVVDFAQQGGTASGELGYMRGEQGVGTGASNFTPAFAGYKHRAGGGYVVGEQGPELFVPEVPGQIIPAGDTETMQSPVNVNFSVSTVNAAGMEELLTEQQGNIIRMIRQAANEHGELFLENIDDSGYGV